MFQPCTFRFRSICSYCGGSIQPGMRGERDRNRKLNHCQECTRLLASRRQERILVSMKVD